MHKRPKNRLKAVNSPQRDILSQGGEKLERAEKAATDSDARLLALLMDMGGSRPGNASELSARLADLIRSGAAPPHSILPGAKRLAMETGLGLAAIYRVYRQLELQGLALSRRKLGLVVAGRFAHAGTDYSLPLNTDHLNAHRLADSLRRQVSGGVYHQGTDHPSRPLPLVKQLVKTLNVSRPTVTRALRLLVEEGTLQVSRRRYFPGLRETGSAAARYTGDRVLLLALNRKQYGSRLGSWRVSDFFRNLEQELSRSNIVLEPLYLLDPIEGMQRPDKLLNRWASKGYGCKGILILFRPNETALQRSELEAMEDFGKPLAFFEWGFEHLRNLAPCPRTLVADYSEDLLTRTAAWHLFSLGHRHIFYDGNYGEGWTIKRWEQLKANFKSIHPSVEMSCASNPASNRTPRSLEETVAAAEAAFQRIGSAASRSLWQRLCKAASGLPAIALKPFFARAAALAAAGEEGLRATAWVACNDYVARGMVEWLEMARIRVPEEISVLGFDNWQQTPAYGITTVDFGWGNLGYRIGQVFLGHSAIQPDSPGRLMAYPHLIERHSTGSPRRKPL